MSKENKAKKEALKNQFKKSNSTITLEKYSGKLQGWANNIGVREKYKERIKTSYISILGYFFLIYLFEQMRSTEPINISNLMSVLLAGICVAIFNIIKHILSIKDNERKTHNIILLVIQSIFLLFFILCFFY